MGSDGEAKIWQWIAEHDGRINAYWEAQHKLNEQTEAKLNAYGTRLMALEKKVLLFAALGAIAGSILSQVIARMVAG